MNETTEYGGFYVKFTEHAGAAPGQPGYVVLDKNGTNIMPGATFAKTRQQAIQMIDTYRAVGGDGQKFWHLWRAIQRGADAQSEKELTLGDLEAFLTKHALQLRMYFERDDREWVASLYSKGTLDLVPNQPQTFVHAETMDAAITDVIRQWRLSYGGAS